MSDEGEASISKVVGPMVTSSTTASTDFEKALTGVGAAVMGAGALMDSEPLVLGGLAMVAVSLYRQRQGVPQAQEGFGLCQGQVRLPGAEHLAEAYEPQLKEITKKNTQESEDHKTGKKTAKGPQRWPNPKRNFGWRGTSTPSTKPSQHGRRFKRKSGL